MGLAQLALPMFDVQEPPKPLDEEEVEYLHRRLLESSLQLLGTKKAGKAQKDDVLAWVKAEGIWPFSFDLCCVIAGVNPTKMREATLRLIKKLEEENVVSD